MKSVVLFFAILGLTAAQRELSLSVIEGLRQVQPAYRNLQNFVINAVASAKLNSSDVIFDFHNEILMAKDSFVRSAISHEGNTLNHINGQSPDLDESCLNLLRGSVEVNVNLAGVSFSNCISTVDARLNFEIDQIYKELEVNETAYVNFSLYDVFRGQNIFMNPQAIIVLLQAKLAQLQNTPSGLVSELALLIDNFSARLDVARGNYRQCLTVNDQLLQTAINTILIQLQQICQGSLVPNAASTDAPTVPPAAQPAELLWGSL